VIAGIVVIAIEIQQNTQSFEAKSDFTISDTYRNEIVQDTLVQAALSPNFPEFYARWQRNGLGSLSDDERYRIELWETARLYRIEAHFIEWERGLQNQDFLEKELRKIVSRNAMGWRELDLLWIAKGRFREEIDRALE
jgi:hypothetical protein